MRLALCATVVALAGCTTASMLTPSNGREISALSQATSERTFRTMLPVLRECYPVKYAIDANYFPEAKEGEIVVAIQTDAARMEMAKMKIAPRAGGAVVTMLRPTNYDGFDKALPAWIAGADGGCPLGTRPNPQPSGSAKNANNYPVR